MKYVKFQICIKIIYKNLNSVLTCADMSTGTLIPLLIITSNVCTIIALRENARI